MTAFNINTQAEADQLAKAAKTILDAGLLTVDQANDRARALDDAYYALSKHNLYYADTAKRAAETFKPEPTYKNGTLAEVTAKTLRETYVMRKVDGGWSYHTESSSGRHKDYASVYDDQVASVKPLKLANPKRPVQLDAGFARGLAWALRQEESFPGKAAILEDVIKEATAE
jgi:hypothetical protein